jgi:hypothetical protein
VDLGPAVDHFVRDEVATREVRGVRGQRVELTGNVRSTNEPVGRSATRVRADDEHVAMDWRPFALNAQ